VSRARSRPGREPRRPLRVLTIAGSDSGGGAGIQADLKTFAAHGVYGLCAVTAVTAQNTVEVRAVAPVAPEVVAAQIDAVLDDFGADAVKIGMLWSAATVRAVAARLRARRGLPIVLDPVMAAAASGAPLLDDDAAGEALATLIEELLPLATLITPNLPELARLDLALGPAAPAPAGGAAPAARPAARPPVPAPSETPALPSGEAARLALARRLAERGPAVLAKGGHDPGPPAGEVVDLLVEGGGATAGAADRAPGAERVSRFAGPRLPTRAGHGTGCTLSAAIAARLAAGEELAAAVGGAIAYVRQALAAAPALGAGPSPLAHFTPRAGAVP